MPNEIPFDREGLELAIHNMGRDGLVDEQGAMDRISLLEEFRKPLKRSHEDTLLAVFGALANKHRLRILELLKLGVVCSCELEFALKLSQPTVSHHLKKLASAGLVELVREGKWNKIQLTDTPYLECLFDQTEV